jgi:hypothetical protein
MGSRSYSFDKFMQLHDGGAAVIASGFGKVGGSSKIIDLGGATNRLDLGIVGSESRIDAAVVIDISALATVTDGHYRIHVLGSSSANMASPVSLGCLDIGLGTSIAGNPGGLGVAASEAAPLNTYTALPAGNSTWPGRREILFTNEQNDIMNEFIALYVEVLGSTSASILFTAFAAVLPLE